MHGLYKWLKSWIVLGHVFDVVYLVSQFLLFARVIPVVEILVMIFHMSRKNWKMRWMTLE